MTICAIALQCLMYLLETPSVKPVKLVSQLSSYQNKSVFPFYMIMK